MTAVAYKTGFDFAKEMDRRDPLAQFRGEFHVPRTAAGAEEIYLCGNSLGLQPKPVADYVGAELDNWGRLAVKGHFAGDFPWMPYHEFLAPAMAEIVGGDPLEVVVMNTLTTNLHLMMVSFYRPTAGRHKILIEEHAFPSDYYAVESQIRFHGFDPAQSMMQLSPREGEAAIREDDIRDVIEREGHTIALILLPGVQYYTGQLFDMAEITRLGHEMGCAVGFDLAHAAGNVPLDLHDWEVDFAVWCTYKYLNSGPGSVAGCFVHARHGDETDLPRFAGWWGQDKETRFEMGTRFTPIAGAEGWQLSNPPILSLAAIRASLDLFRKAGYMQPLRDKSVRLTGYLEWLLARELAGQIEVITPQDPNSRGCQLSLIVKRNPATGGEMSGQLDAAGVTCDWRDPNVIRVAPAPLYNSFEDCYCLVACLKAICGDGG